MLDALFAVTFGTKFYTVKKGKHPPAEPVIYTKD